ncbi:MAG: transporter [Candidatus Omnitrophica bacterium]|nr:transporter [Candidatus Omnitrophota bacterium]
MFKNVLLVFVSGFIIVSWTGFVWAGRPFSTEDAGVAGKGVAQLEIGAEYARQTNGDKEYASLFVPVYGLTELMEFSAEFPHKLTNFKEGGDEEGLEDVSLVLKTLIVEEVDNTPAFLVKTVVKLDNGNKDKGLGSGDKDLGMAAVATKSIGSLTFHANFGYTFVGKDFDPTLKDYILYGVAGEYAVGDKARLMMELYGESNSHFDADAFKHHDLQALLGSTYQLTERIVFDAAIKIGLTDDSPDYGLTSGVSIGF